MPWNEVWPIGNVSVKSNKAPGLQNTEYITATMGKDVVGTNAASTKDHFWNVSGDLDGHHRFMKMPKFTVGGSLANPNLGAGIDGSLYLREVGNGNTRSEIYFNSNVSPGVFQVTPTFKSKTLNVVLSPEVIDQIDPFSYGEIYMWPDDPTFEFVQFSHGYFYSNATIVTGYSSALKYSNVGTGIITIVTLINSLTGTANSLDLKGIFPSGNNWQIRIMYRSYA